MLAAPCLILHKALAVRHSHPRAAGSTDPIPSPVPRSPRREKHNFSGLEGKWGSTQDLAALGASALPSDCVLWSPPP